MYLVGRVLKAHEFHEAFGLSRSGYRKALDEGRLITADNLLRVADHFGINYIELMSRFGLINDETIEGFIGRAPDFHSVTTLPRVVTTTPVRARPARRPRILPPHL